MSPVTLPELKALLISATSPTCDGFSKALLRLPIELYKIFAWMLNADGSLSSAFLRSVTKPGDYIFSAAPLAADADRLLCDGSEVNRTDYADLFAAIGTTYGTPSSGTVFKLPDCRARFPVGVGTFASAASATLGVPLGEEKHELSVAELAPHRHWIANVDTIAPTGTAHSTPTITGGNQTASGSDGDSHSSAYQLQGTATDATIGQTSSTGGDTGEPIATRVAEAHNNLPPGMPCFIYVKT